MGKLLNYLGESKILKRIADVLNVKDVKVNDSSVVDEYGDANISVLQSDWNQTDNTQLDYIKNKPSIPAGQVQSDWDEDDTSDPAYIKNKPAIPTDFVPKSTGGTFDANVNIVTKHTQTTNVNSVISLGNNIPVGTAGTSRGILQLWSNTGKWVNFIPSLNPANVSLSLPMVSGTLALTSDISSMAVNWDSNSILGAKNLVAYPYVNASGHNPRGSIVFTYNEEGYISVNGTNTTQNSADFIFYNAYTSDFLLESGKEYILSLERTNDLIYGILYFKDAAGNNLTLNYEIEYENGDSETRNTYYVSLNRDILHTIAKFKILDANIKCYSELRMRIGAGAGPFNSTKDKGRFMLRLADDSDDTWQPYSMTNQKLTKVLRGVPTTAGTYTLQATRNADNSITYSWV